MFKKPIFQGGKMDPNAALAFAGIGQSLAALGQGRSYDPSGMMNAMAANDKEAEQQEALQNSGALELFDEREQAVLASMPPGLAQRTILQRMESRHAAANRPSTPPKWVDGHGFVDPNNVPEHLMAGNYEAQPEWQSVSGADAASMGLPGGSVWQQNSQTGQIREVYQPPAPQVTNINNNMGTSMPGLSKLGEGYTFLYNPDGTVKLDEQGRPMAAPVPGGPKDTAEQDAAVLSAKSTSSDLVTTAASRARDAASKQDFGPTGTSLVGMLPWTDSAEVMRQVGTLKSLAAAENLNAMRRQSPTGGALGNVTEKELALLQNMSGALDPNSPNFARDLDDYERTLLRVIHGQQGGDEIWDSTRDGAGMPPGENPFIGMSEVDFSKLDIESLTPEQIKQLAAARGVK